MVISSKGIFRYSVFACLIGLIAMRFWQVLYSVFLKCWSNDDYSHGLLLPFASFAMFWMERDRIFSVLKSLREKEDLLSGGRVCFSWIGAFLLVAGASVDVMDEVSGLRGFLRWVAFFLVASGALLLAFGTARGKVFLPMLLLNYMAMPFPGSLSPFLFNPLQTLAAKIGARVLESLDVPVYLVGNIIEVPGLRLFVEEACSGMRSVMSLVTVAIIVSYIVGLRFWGSLMIIVSSVFIAISFNVLRVTITGVLAYFVDRSLASGFFHEFTGMIVFILGFAVVYNLANFSVSMAVAKKKKKMA